MGLRLDYDDLIGIPFVRGGSDPSEGFDCLGLAIECFNRLGFDMNLPPFDYSVGWQNRAVCYLAKHSPRYFDRVEGETWEVGDLAVTRPTEDEPLHLGIVAEPDRVLHTRRDVGVHTVSTRAFRPLVRVVYRFRGRA